MNAVSMEYGSAPGQYANDRFGGQPAQFDNRGGFDGNMMGDPNMGYGQYGGGNPMFSQPPTNFGYNRGYP